MKRTALAITLVMALTFSCLFCGILVQPVKANPYSEEKFGPPPADVKPPAIIVMSPEENAYYSNVSSITLAFNVTGPESPTIRSGYITSVQYRGDWMQNVEIAFDYLSSHSNPSFLKFALNITGIPEGKHNIVVNAFGGGGYAEGLTWYNFDINSSSTVNFTIGKEPLTTPEFPSFLILPLFIIATLLVGVIYRRKRKH